jgi:hypothetical protein
VVVLKETQVLFLYDFDGEGLPLADPVAKVPRRTLLKYVAEVSGLSFKALKKLSSDRGGPGQKLGEILVAEGLVTPLLWRVLCVRLVARPPSRWFAWRRR